MKTPALHFHEHKRIEALYDLEILDTHQEESFERITRLAMQICEVPIGGVAFIDKDRMWFKSHIGFPRRETTRDISFCAHALHEKNNFYVSDTREDERFFDNPLVEGDPFIRFYAGCPLFMPGELPIGALCVVDTKPRKLSREQLSGLRDLGDCLQREFELRMLAQDVKRLTRSPALASYFQSAKYPA